MLIEESIWIKTIFEKYFSEENFPLLNIGSSTVHFRKVVQPQIHEHVFLPLENKNLKIIHLDMKMEEGVDLIGDLSNDEFRSSLKKIGIKSVLCSNLLEHLSDPRPICNSILDLLNSKDLIIVTVPKSFPYHKDPIDTYFRPSVEELHLLFPNTKIIRSEVVVSKASYAEDLKNNKRFCAIMIARLVLPFFRPNEWSYILKDFLRMSKKYSATCVILEKK
jgi:hypothetical protein